MKRRIMLTAAVSALATLAATSPPPARASLTQTFQQSGNLGLEVMAVAGGNLSTVTGSFTPTLVPGSASIVKATLYASQNGNSSGMNATFNGASLGIVGPSASDPGMLTLYTYQWDVTLFTAPPIGPWNFSVWEPLPGGLGIAGVALAVVWSDPGEPTRTVTIIDGMQQVGESGPETETVIFTGMPAGSTGVWVFTVYDDSTASGETVSYNGSTIGGPIDQFLGMNASLLQMTATSVTGSDTLSITTGMDAMGWMIGATAVKHTIVPVERRSWGRVKNEMR